MTTYLEQAITTMGDIPGAILGFAAARGWTVAGLLLTRPGGGRQFGITTLDAANGVSTVEVYDVLTPTRRAILRRPRRKGTFAAPINLAPTKVHLFGNDAGDTEARYISAVVEFGYNVYRHLYIGNINKIGAFTGGEMICANSWCEEYNGNTRVLGFNSYYNKYLFAASNIHVDFGDLGGGIMIDHPDNPSPWRVFDGPVPGFNMLNNLTGKEVFGGWPDGINGSLAQRGLASYAASNVLTPINLYGSRAADGANFRFIPFGDVPGIRLIRMDGIDPGEQIEIADETWMVFPEFSRSVNTTTKREIDASGFYWEYETSYLCGLAYRMG